MRIITGIKISFANKNLCYKTLAFKFVVYSLFIALFYSLASSVLIPIINSEGAKGIIDCFADIFRKFLTVENFSFDGQEVSQTLKENTTLLLNFISKMSSKLIWSAVALTVALIILTFLNGAWEYVIAVNLNEHMSSIRHAGVINTLLENFKKASVYGAIKTLALTLYNAVVFSLIYLSILSLIKIGVVFVLSIIFLIIFVAIAIRMTITSLMLPYMVCDNKGVKESIKLCFKNNNRQVVVARFLSYLVMSILAYVITLLSSLVTFGIALLVAVPVFTVSFVAIRFIDFYTVHQRKYYITYDEIYVPKSLRSKDEQLLNDVDI